MVHSLVSFSVIWIHQFKAFQSLAVIILSIRWFLTIVEIKLLAMFLVKVSSKNILSFDAQIVQSMIQR